LGVAPAVLLADRQALLPSLRRVVQHSRCVRVDRSDDVIGGGMLAHHSLVRVGISLIAVVRPDDAGQLS